jgi:hypothetical protein
MGAAERRQPLDQLTRHVLGGAGCPGGDRRQTCGNSQQVFNTVTHFAGEEFVSFFGLLPQSHIEENSEHGSTNNAHVLTLTASSDPAYLIANHYSKVSLVWTKNGSCGREGGPHTIPISWVNML